MKLRTPSYPLLTPEQRAAHPPVYQPLVYADPHTVRRGVRGGAFFIFYVSQVSSTTNVSCRRRCALTTQGVKSLYGFSSSVCAVVTAGTQLAPEALDVCELEAAEVPSVRALLYDELLPWATQDRFVYGHAWEEGDLVLWDNPRTIHAATPFDAESHPRRGLYDLNPVETRSA